MGRIFRIVAGVMLVFSLAMVLFAAGKAHGSAAVWICSATGGLLTVYLLYRLYRQDESTDQVTPSDSHTANDESHVLNDAQRRSLLAQLDAIYATGAGYGGLLSYLAGIKAFSECGIEFVALEDAIQRLQGWEPSKIYLFLDDPLNDENQSFYEYIRDLVGGSNTDVTMYPSQEHLTDAYSIRECLVEDIKRRELVDLLFHVPAEPNDAFLIVNCVIVDPGEEKQRVFLVPRGRDGKSLIALLLPNGPMANRIVTKAEKILNIDRRLHSTS